MSEFYRGAVRVVCPVPVCGTSVKGLMAHANRMHANISQEEFADSLAKGPFNFVRCGCGYMSPTVPNLVRHKRRLGHEDLQEAEPEHADSGSEVSGEDDGGAELPQAAAGAHPVAGDVDDMGGEDGDGEGAEEPALDDSGYFKHPALNKLTKPALKVFGDIVVKLLSIALGRSDAAVVSDRALQALRNLPGIVRDLEYSANGSSRNRKRHLQKVLESLASSSTILRECERLYGRMAERRGRAFLRTKSRGQVGLEQRWDEVCPRVAAMVREGNPGAALSLVEDWATGVRGNEPLRTVEEVRALLVPYFPAATEDDVVLSYEERIAGMEPSDIKPPHQLTEEQVEKAMASLQRGRAAGQSGWTNSLLKRLALMPDRHPQLVPLFTRWFNKTLRGLVGPSQMWTLGRAGLLGKPDGGTRVLSVGETLVRFMSHVVISSKKEEAAVKLGPHQLSVGVRGGAEQITQAFSLGAKEVNAPQSGKAIVALDVKNAHPSMRRRKIADAVWEYFPELYHFFVWGYGDSSLLVLLTGEIVATIGSGVRMGDPAAGFWFDLGLKPVLDKVEEVAPEAEVLFYADDGQIMGTSQAAKDAAVAIVEGLQSVGCEVHLLKSIYFDGEPAADGDTELMGQLSDGSEVRFKRAEGAKIVGRAVGLEDWVEASITKSMEKHIRGLEVIWELPPDVALLLLTFCINARPMYLARNFPPEIIGGHLRKFDALVDECLCKIIQVGPDFDGGWWIPRLRGLPVDLAGIALPRLENVCRAAHTSCLVEALVGLSPRLGSARVHALMEHLSQGEKDAITHFLPFCIGENGGLRLPGDPTPGVAGAPPEGPVVDLRGRFEEEMARVRQFNLCKALYKQEYHRLYMDLRGGGEFQRAAAVLSTAPKPFSRCLRGSLFQNTHNRLNSEDFTDFVRSRLLVKEFTGTAFLCGCAFGVNLRENPWHAQSCQSAGGEITGRHDRVVNAVEQFAKQCVGATGVVHHEVYVEPREDQGLAAYRMDFTVTTALGRSFQVDVAVATPCAQSRSVGTPNRSLAANREGAAFVKGYAAAVREEDKRGRALKCLTPEELSGFVPFVVETTGLLGEAAKAFLATLGQAYIARVGDGGPAALRKLQSNLFLEIGMVLARGMARIKQAGRSKMREVPFGHPADPGDVRAASPLGDDIGGDLGVEEEEGGGGGPPQGNGQLNNILNIPYDVEQEGDGPPGE